MPPANERIEELLHFIQEADLPTLREFDDQLHALLEQKSRAQRKEEQGWSVREEFQQRYPHITIDPELFALVGIQPENPLEDDTMLIRDQIARRLMGENSG